MSQKRPKQHSTLPARVSGGVCICTYAVEEATFISMTTLFRAVHCINVCRCYRNSVNRGRQPAARASTEGFSRAVATVPWCGQCCTPWVHPSQPPATHMSNLLLHTYLHVHGYLQRNDVAPTFVGALRIEEDSRGARWACSRGAAVLLLTRVCMYACRY